jgi:uncharacterized Zn-binding protein involved in type VI secretion
MMGKGVVRLGDMCTGHQCWPPRPNCGASMDVFTNKRGTHRVGDAWLVHCCFNICHPGVTTSGSNTVFVNNIPIARINDPVSCGSFCLGGSTDVFAGD